MKVQIFFYSTDNIFTFDGETKNVMFRLL